MTACWLLADDDLTMPALDIHMQLQAPALMKSLRQHTVRALLSIKRPAASGLLACHARVAVTLPGGGAAWSYDFAAAGGKQHDVMGLCFPADARAIPRLTVDVAQPELSREHHAGQRVCAALSAILSGTAETPSPAPDFPLPDPLPIDSGAPKPKSGSKGGSRSAGAAGTSVLPSLAPAVWGALPGLVAAALFEAKQYSGSLRLAASLAMARGPTGLSAAVEQADALLTCIPRNVVNTAPRFARMRVSATVCAAAADTAAAGGVHDPLVGRWWRGAWVLPMHLDELASLLAIVFDYNKRVLERAGVDVDDMYALEWTDDLVAAGRTGQLPLVFGVHAMDGTHRLLMLEATCSSDAVLGVFQQLYRACEPRDDMLALFDTHVTWRQSLWAELGPVMWPIKLRYPLAKLAIDKPIALDDGARESAQCVSCFMAIRRAQLVKQIEPSDWPTAAQLRACERDLAVFAPRQDYDPAGAQSSDLRAVWGVGSVVAEVARPVAHLGM